MIVTCPSCSARYKINESKIKGRGAKITCPRCSHRFVVYRDQDDAGGRARRKVPDNVAELDFSTLGITWRVRKGIGVTYDFYDLATLQRFLRDGQVERWDAISYDNRDWAAIETIDDLEEHFYDVWQRAMRGEISFSPVADDEDDEEDESDAPTTIVGRGSSLASEIRQAITEASTPPPVGSRVSHPALDDDDEPSVGRGPTANAHLAYAEPPSESELEVDAEPEEEPSPPTPVPQNEPEPAPLPSNGPAPLGGSARPGSLSASAPKPVAPKPVAEPVKPAAEPAEPEPTSGSNVGLVVGSLVVVLILALVALGGLWAAGVFGGAEPAASASDAAEGP